MKFKIEDIKEWLNEKELIKSLNEWEKRENLVSEESFLRDLFQNKYKNNTNFNEIFVKVITLDALYNTHLKNHYKMAKYIESLNIDKDLKLGNTCLVNKIASLKINENKTINCLSFASKYCSWHQPDKYPIKDSIIHSILLTIIKHNNDNIKANNLNNYCCFKDQFDKYIKSKFPNNTYKKIDKHLWLKGTGMLLNKFDKN
ncbi:hypothetical protein [Mycoplasmopsis lipofaciens]|uniref:hypothetical protein n=1 Tax=Mycoplasmopsis lipofaciens TaxID=114884 RepID=UPI00068C15E1|nr:hypothetical protein [Mycoplasmopsis lipofaciens]